MNIISLLLSLAMSVGMSAYLIYDLEVNYQGKKDDFEYNLAKRLRRIRLAFFTILSFIVMFFLIKELVMGDRKMTSHLSHSKHTKIE